MKRNKKLLIGILVIVAIVVLFKFPRTVDKPCDWCDKRPSVAYDMSDGSKSYVCMDCYEDITDTN